MIKILNKNRIRAGDFHLFAQAVLLLSEWINKTRRQDYRISLIDFSNKEKSWDILIEKKYVSVHKMEDYNAIIIDGSNKKNLLNKYLNQNLELHLLAADKLIKFFKKTSYISEKEYEKNKAVFKLLEDYKYISISEECSTIQIEITKENLAEIEFSDYILGRESLYLDYVQKIFHK